MAAASRLHHAHRSLQRRACGAAGRWRWREAFLAMEQHRSRVATCGARRRQVPRFSDSRLNIGRRGGGCHMRERLAWHDQPVPPVQICACCCTARPWLGASAAGRHICVGSDRSERRGQCPYSRAGQRVAPFGLFERLRTAEPASAVCAQRLFERCLAGGATATGPAMAVVSECRVVEKGPAGPLARRSSGLAWAVWAKPAWHREWYAPKVARSAAFAKSSGGGSRGDCARLGARLATQASARRELHAMPGAP